MLRPALRCGTTTLALLFGCVDAPSIPERREPPHVVFAPADGGEPWPATRIGIQSRGPAPDAYDVGLFEGALSDSKLARLDDEPWPKTLSALSRPILAWTRESSSELFVQPLTWLTPGGEYTLAARGFGRLASFVVAHAPERPSFVRLWPPAGFPGGGCVVLCGSGSTLETRAIVLEPGSVHAELVPDWGTSQGRRCGLVLFDATNLEGALVLPPAIDDAALEAFAIEIGPRDSALAFPVCTADEVELGPGCARAEDDRVIVRSADQPLLWRFDPAGLGVESPVIVASEPNGEFVVRGLTPGTTLTLTGSVTATDGAEARFEAELTTSAPRVRLVVNEVLANPLGPEPAGEWVELYNAGVSAVSLEGMRLRDAGGSIELPDVTVEAGEFALVVREDFAPGPGDVAPDASVKTVVVPQLAKNGLSNSGEPVALVDASGRVLSAFPAIAAPHGGVSIARSRPDALDTDTRAFSEHAAPGASPGAPNRVTR